MMNFFGTSNDPSVEEVEKATDEKNTDDDWATIMNICDKAGKTTDHAKNYLRAISKRIHNQDPHIGVQAVTLLDACIKNCGKTFHVEVASREFENDINKLMTKGHPTVAKKLRESLKKWTENEFKQDPQLNLIPSLYARLRSQGYDFAPSDSKPVKKISTTKDPNVVESAKEEEDVIKAIELSLKEQSGSPQPHKAHSATHNGSLYPSTNLSAVPASSTVVKEPKKVRALYDFEAAEDNELTFNSGEIIFVIDDTDANWWKGSNQRGEGLFPANFVTTDLSIEPEKFLYDKVKKNVQFNENVEVKVESQGEVEINEEKINRLLHLLHEADPTNPENDTEEMLILEREVNGMGSLIDSELEKVDRKHAQLTQLSADLVEALSLYHTLMRDIQIPQGNKMAPYGYMGPPPNFNGPPPQMGPPMQGPMPGQHMPMPVNMPPGHFMGHNMGPPGVHMGNFPPQNPQQINALPNITDDRKPDQNVYYK